MTSWCKKCIKERLTGDARTNFVWAPERREWMKRAESKISWRHSGVLPFTFATLGTDGRTSQQHCIIRGKMPDESYEAKRRWNEEFRETDNLGSVLLLRSRNFNLHTEMANKDGTWLREISSCCCLTTAGKSPRLDFISHAESSLSRPRMGWQSGQSCRQPRQK